MTYFDRVQETSNTTGTGTITLLGAVAGFQSFAVVGNGNTCSYCIVDSSNAWEVGQGTYTSSGTTLSRDSVFASSNSNALVNLAAGTSTVFLTVPASNFNNFMPTSASGAFFPANASGSWYPVSSGKISSGAIIGQAGGGPFNIGSGTIGSFDIASGAIVSGRIASGQIGINHLASGLASGNYIPATASGAFFPANASGNWVDKAISGTWIDKSSSGLFFPANASGIWPNAFGLTSGCVQSGHIGNNAVTSGNIASGQIGINHLASGLASGAYIPTSASGVFFPANQSGNWVDKALSGTWIDKSSSGVFFPANQSGKWVDIAQSGTWIDKSSSGLFFPANASGIWYPLKSGAVNSGAISSGAVQGFYGTTRHISSGTVGSFDISSGAITSGKLGVTGTPDGTKVLRDDFTWVAPSSPTINSGSVQSGHIASGSVQGFYGTTRHIASGTIGSYDYASGNIEQFTGPYVSGTNWTAKTEETVSGIRAVSMSQSGYLRIAMAGTSGRMPAIGFVYDNVASGITANVYTAGAFQFTSGMADYSGNIGQLVYVGRSGNIVSISGSFNSGGLLSGDVWQPLGVANNSGGATIGIAAQTPLTPTLAYSGNIASGAISQFHLSSGAVNSGHIGANVFVQYAQQTMFEDFVTAEIVSGTRGVCLTNSGTIAVAQGSSGLRLPAIGVNASGALSGTVCRVIMAGKLNTNDTASYSGQAGKTLYVSSSGFQITSTKHTSSGLQRLGVALSGGLFVQPDFCWYTSSGAMGN